MTQNETTKRKVNQPVTSLALPDGTLFELLYDHTKNTTSLARWKSGDVQIESSFKLETGQRLLPYGPQNPLLQQRIVLFPEEPKEYRDENALIEEIRSFIHRYVDVSKVFETIAVYYVFLTWVYETFNEVPYLKPRGDYGTGKTRFLLVVGSLCYKPIFASGASTVAPLFHILDQIGGTLILDEGDFRFSDEKADIAKILNNGNAKGFPVLRCEKINQKEFAPRAYSVFGPKILGSRNDYEDYALESRFITEDMGLRPVRTEIPITLPPSFHEEALELRNKLLLWRFRNYGRKRFPEAHVDPKLDQRINQIFVPLLSLISDAKVRAQLVEIARKKNAQMRSDRGFQVEAEVLSSIQRIYSRSSDAPSISAITKSFIESYGDSYDHKISPKWIGSIVRKKLRLSTRKKNGVYVLAENQKRHLRRLYRKYDLRS